jgi:hypothetical protein
MLELQPLTFREAKAFIKEHHSHHNPPQGMKFCIGVNDGESVVGVIVVGRPVSRRLDDGWTAEVTRCCTIGVKNSASMLYGAAWRACKAMGYKKLVTYTLVEEKGTSLKAAGYKIVGQSKGGSWSSKNRPRIDTHPTGQKTIWEKI